MNHVHVITKKPIPQGFVKPLIVYLLKYVLFATSELPSLEAHDRKSRLALLNFDNACAELEQHEPETTYQIVMGRTAKRPVRRISLHFTSVNAYETYAELSDYVRLFMRHMASVPFTIDRDPLSTFVFAGKSSNFNLSQLVHDIDIQVGPPIEHAHEEALEVTQLCKVRGFAESQEDLELDY